MKMIICGMAAAFMATAALAQTTPPPPADPMNSPSAMPPADAAAPAPPVAAEAPIGPQLVQKDGKWWNGDRKATRTEIAQYKAANPKTPS